MSLVSSTDMVSSFVRETDARNHRLRTGSNELAAGRGVAPSRCLPRGSASRYEHEMALEIGLLGRFVVCRDGREIPSGEFGGRLSRRLVRLLVVARGSVVTRDALIDALWGDRAPSDPAANLNVLVNRARHGLGDPALIETVAGGYAFRGGADTDVDVERFAVQLRSAWERLARDDPAGALEAVEAALATWRGDPLPEDAYTDWARSHRDRLEQDHQDALELGGHAALAAGDPRRAATLAAEAAARAPLREAAHLLLVRALAAGGDRAGALAALGALRDRFADELGIDPSREAAELQVQLLRDEPADSPVLPQRATALFVGRERELQRLHGLDAEDRVALVAGRSGSGKSRLLGELASRSRRRVLTARAVLAERDAPWGLVRTLLRAVLRAGVDPATALPPRLAAAVWGLLPELDSPPATLDPQTRRALALEATVRLVAATGSPLVLIDDLQWADASSLDALAVTAARGEEVTLVLAYRPEEVTAHPEVGRFLGGLRAAGASVEVGLGRLDAAAVAALVADAELAALLAEQTDGTPFAILEVIRSLVGDGALRRGERGRWHSAGDVLDRARVAARAGQRRSILQRAEGQPPLRRELLALLALLGRPAAARLLAEAAGAPTAEVLAGLDGLGRAELVGHRERGFAVAHDLVGETIRDQLDPVERARRHDALARALEQQPDTSGERAGHLAGAGDHTAAAAAYAVAARERLDRFAHREAARLAEAGLRLDPPDEPATELLEVRAVTREREGDRDAARDDLRAALKLAASPGIRSHLLIRLATLAVGSEDLIRAGGLVDLALAEAGDDPAARARALAVGAIVDMNLEQPCRAQQRYAAALALYERVGDPRGVADILDAQAMAGFLDGDIDGDIDGGIDAFDRVARLFADTGNLLRVITPRSTRGHGLVFADRAGDGLADTAEAVELAHSLGYPDGETYALWHHSEALAACGRIADAIGAA
ncbi:MAG: AAA family ATPase [Pseudonocardiaceae bacterium]|nr:AAA family ATPase [Pseudonocardiaceae bacterium]